MGWTMTLKDDFGVIAWTRRGGNHHILFLLLSLFFFSVQSDIVFPKDHHFSWKAGKTFKIILSAVHIYFPFWVLNDNFKCIQMQSSLKKSVSGCGQCIVLHEMLCLFTLKCEKSQDRPLVGDDGSHNHTPTHTLIVLYILTRVGYYCFSLWEKNTISRSILRASSLGLWGNVILLLLRHIVGSINLKPLLDISKPEGFYTCAVSIIIPYC